MPGATGKVYSGEFKAHPQRPFSIGGSEIHAMFDVRKCPRLSVQRFDFSLSWLSSNWCQQFPFFPDLSEQLLRRKMEICENILRVYDAVDPGEANQRNNVMFELKCATIIQTKIKLSQNVIERQQAIVWNVCHLLLWLYLNILLFIQAFDRWVSANH